jgi:membrane-bound serine protease (ClpP class)
MRVSLGVIIPAVILTALFFLFAVGLGLQAQRKRVATGVEGLVGEIGEATARLDPTGTVAVHGEFWKADSVGGTPIEEGTSIEVVQVAGLRLLVRPASRSPFDEQTD